MGSNLTEVTVKKKSGCAIVRNNFKLIRDLTQPNSVRIKPFVYFIVNVGL